MLECYSWNHISCLALLAIYFLRFHFSRVVRIKLGVYLARFRFQCNPTYIMCAYKTVFRYYPVDTILWIASYIFKYSTELELNGARCSSVVRAFTHGAMGRRIDLL